MFIYIVRRDIRRHGVIGGVCNTTPAIAEDERLLWVTVLRSTDHNHSASAIEVRESINEMKVIAGNSNDPCGAILREVSQHIP